MNITPSCSLKMDDVELVWISVFIECLYPVGFFFLSRLIESCIMLFFFFFLGNEHICIIVTDNLLSK